MAEQLQNISLVSPGFRGLNFAQASNILSPEYATAASNAVLDSSGRLAARDGYTNQTATPIAGTPDVKTVFEYRTGAGGRSLIVAWDGGIGNDIGDPAGNDISGAVSDSDGRWWMQNFNDKVIALQNGQKPIVYTGTGSFATVVESSGTAPSVKDGVGLCAYGRLWAVDADGVTIKYSGLLDETDWAGVTAGQIDLHNIWTAGQDTITAIAAFNGALIVFGHNHIVFLSDNAGSVLGVDPNNIYVVDIITGTGCVSQWTVQAVGEADLLFLSRNGVQSLQRLLTQKSNPITNLTKTVRAELTADMRSEGDPLLISSAYSPKEGMYVLTFPTANRTWSLDMRYPYQDEQGDLLSIVTEWSLAPNSWGVRDNDDILLGNSGIVGVYGGTSDDGSTFRFVYESPWLDLGENLANRLKMLKRIGAIIFVQDAAAIVFKWAVDFDGTFDSLTETIEGDAGAEYSVDEWSIGEYSGGLSLRIIKQPARDTGQYFKVGVEADITGTFALQQLELFAKIGRLA